MPFEPFYENLAACRQTVKTEEKIKAECRTEIPSESVSDVLNVSARAVITDKERTEGGVGYSGKVTFFVCYIDTRGDIKKCECGAEFSGALKVDGEYFDAFVCAIAEKAEADASGVKLTVRGYVSIKGEVFSVENKRALCRGDGLIVREEEIVAVKSFGVREACLPVEEEIDLNYKIEQMISQSACVTVTSAQCGVGAIIVDGETFLSFVMLQSGEKNGIIREDKVIPFRMEIECEDAMPSGKAIARACVKSFKTDVLVDEDAGVSRINVNLTIKGEGEAFIEETRSVAGDVFDIEREVEIEKEKAAFIFREEVKSEKFRVTERVTVDEIAPGAYVAATFGEKAEITATEYSADGISVSGAITLNTVMADRDGKLVTRKLEAPFTYKIKAEGATDVTAFADAVASSAKIVSATEIEVSADIVVTAYPERKEEYKIIKEIKITGEKTANVHAVSVYLALSGEDLWGLSKRLGVHPQTVLESNPELQFPLSGEERIVVYRQK